MKYEIYKGARDKVEILIDDDDFDKVSEYNWGLISSIFSGQTISGHKKGDFKKVYFLNQVIMNTTNLVKHLDSDVLNNKKSNLQIYT